MKRIGTVLFAMLVLAFALPAFAQQRWERNYGGAGNDQGLSVQQTQDGGYVVAGTTTSFGNGVQAYLIKTNASGDDLWMRNWGGANTDMAFSVQQTQDGGYVVAGWVFIDVSLTKTDASGNILWTRQYGGDGADGGYSVQQTQDGGYIVAGISFDVYQGDSLQVYLVKTNASGDTLWTRTYGGARNDHGRSVQQTQDTGYIIAGYTTSFGSGWQVYLVKTNASGDTLWTRTFGGAGDDNGYSVRQTQDGGYIVAGYTGSFGNGNQVYLVKTNATGDTLWTRTYGGTGDDQGLSVQQTQDGGYVVAGETTSFGNGYEVYLIKTNASGDTLWTRTYGGAGDERGFSVRQTSDGGYIVTGFTASFGNGNQVYLVKTDSGGRSSGVEEESQNAKCKLQIAKFKITPNPFTSFAAVPGHEREAFSLYDVAGRKVGSYQGDRIGEGLAPGVYFLKPEGEEGKPLRVVKLR